MDPAGAASQDWQSGVEKALLQHESILSQIVTSVNRLSEQFSRFSSPHSPSPASLVAPPPPAPSPHPDREPKIPPPERYGGEPGTCRAFLTQCEEQFKLQPSAFPTVTGCARLWVTAAWGRDSLAQI